MQHILNQPSENFDDRAAGAKARFIVLHYTGTNTAGEARAVYLNASPNQNFGRVSTHYMVDLDGTVTQHVPEDKRAWHAGKSYWDGISDLNSWSIGIEIVNAGHAGHLPPFPQAQINALVTLCGDIMLRHNIKPHQVLGHSDIAVTRKIDPGEHFPWAQLAAQNIGVWPQPEKADFESAHDALEIEEMVRAMLNHVGYDPNLPMNEVLAAFQRHYHPEIFNESGAPGLPNINTLARLICLFRSLPDKE